MTGEVEAATVAVVPWLLCAGRNETDRDFL